MNPLEVLARLIADLYQQIAELKAQLEAKEIEMDELAQSMMDLSPNRLAEQKAEGDEDGVERFG